MSASPSGLPNGRTPNSGVPLPMRRPKPADPLRRPKERRPRRPPPPGTSATNTNGLAIVGNSKPHTKTVPHITNQTAPTNPLPIPTQTILLTGGGAETSGFSSIPDGPYQDFPLITTKRALMEGLRHHVARFTAKKPVDPRNEAEFTRPVRLHRRDPRAPLAGAGGAVKDEDGEEVETDPKALAEEREREKLEEARAEREKQREFNLSQIAPSADGAKKSNALKTGARQRYGKQTEEAEAERKLNYEEALPWHLEDFDNKNTWVGNYESALSGGYAMLILQPDNTFRMVSVEKWYKFTAKNQFKTLTIEEAEKRMSKKSKEPRWFMDAQKASKDVKQESKATSKLFVGKLGKAEDADASIRNALGRSEDADADDLDFEEDRFADDEENPTFEGEEDEAKEAQERIKKDQLQANIFDLKDEKEFEKAEAQERKQKELQKRLGKDTRKAFKKREKNYLYESDDSDKNPYSSSSESEDTETERLKEEERKKEEDKKAALEREKQKFQSSEKLPSGASSKGTNTPSGRPKHSDPLKKGPSSSLKRPGSPNLSEASGTESARKKHKKNHGSSSQSTHTSTPLPGSRPMSPAPSDPSRPQPPLQRKSSIIKLSVEPSKLHEISATTPRPSDHNKRSRTAAGSGSEAEATGGEMSSDGAKKKRIKLRMGGSSKSGTPQGSRAGSPVPAAQAGGAGAQRGSVSVANGARAGSPAGTSTPTLRLAPATEDEIIKSIPAQGTTIGELLALFKGRVGDRGRFISLIKANSKYGQDKKLRPKNDEPAPAAA
ncbi:MAG: hypothetical protein M1827_006007 [Pycnora praestabilis]|nr:MAG: hypothetical protein M1827_006007 [Pycnora praestabilis]